MGVRDLFLRHGGHGEQGLCDQVLFVSPDCIHLGLGHQQGLARLDDPGATLQVIPTCWAQEVDLVLHGQDSPVRRDQREGSVSRRVISHGGHYACVYEAILLKVTVPDADPRNESARVEGYGLEAAIGGKPLNRVLFQQVETILFLVHVMFLSAPPLCVKCGVAYFDTCVFFSHPMFLRAHFHKKSLGRTKMLISHGADLSPPSCKVRFAANALGLTYEYKKVDLINGENTLEGFLKLNPAGKVPVIEDDGFVLFESNAIIKYLAAKSESSLYPAGTKQRAVIDQWVDFVSHHVATAMNRVLFNRVFAPFLKMEVDERSLSEGLSFLDRFLPVVDNPLKERRYLAGGELTLADLDLLSALDPAEVAQVDLSGYLNISRWRQDLMGRDFYTKCHKSYGDVLAAMAG